MKIQLLPLLAALALPHFVCAEDGKPVKFDQLPEAVAKAVKTATGGADIKELTTEKEDGVDAYEAVWIANGRRHEVTVAKDGKVLCREETIPLEEVPKAAREAIEKEAAGGKIAEVEKVIENGRTFYEAVIKTAKGEVELKLDARGKVLEREKGDGKD